ncbi:hypothetical protein QBC40DRAFT_265182 [Triangularia verruculosa]|uniref:MYND-type zinc finger protein samB n=1 Tax=Triangularia verruculosa TaxID=2587418 RepID=A0AAN7AT87_9PEZI|nr:hypothetical protein QBC40DRAFT_265182 [Triangularia verruculosa]
MTAILLQCALAAAQDARFASEASKIHQKHQATHVTNNTQSGNDPTPHDAVIGCQSCYSNILDLYKARFFSNPPADLPKDPSLSHQGEWFTSATPSFLEKLADLIDQAKQYKIHPRLVDEHVRKEKERWYADNLTTLRLRSMVEEEDREAIAEKLEEFTAGSASIEHLMIVVSASLRKLAGNESLPAADLPERLLAATNHPERVEILKKALFMTSSPSTEGGQGGEVPEAHKKFSDMLSQDNSSMEQVKDKILEERQHASSIQDQIEKVKTRLAELRRAQSAYALEKAKKAENKKRLAEQQQKSAVPEELYNLPPCSVCHNAVNPGSFKVCTFCTLMVGCEVEGAEKTVYCSADCLHEGYPKHLKSHHCSAGSSCVHATGNPSRPLQKHDKHGHHDVEMEDPLPVPDDTRFCKECLVNVKKATAWCSPACALVHYLEHRQEVHASVINGDVKMEINGYVEDVDFNSVTITLVDLVKDWETRNGVRLEE